MSDIRQISEQIVTICQNPNSALQAIHLLLVNGQASTSAFYAIYQRVLEDDDVDGAYYLAVFAQNNELPFDVVPLIKLVLIQGKQELRLALLDKLPKEAVAHLQSTMDLDFYSLCKV